MKYFTPEDVKAIVETFRGKFAEDDWPSKLKVGSVLMVIQSLPLLFRYPREEIVRRVNEDSLPEVVQDLFRKCFAGEVSREEASDEFRELFGQAIEYCAQQGLEFTLDVPPALITVNGKPTPSYRRALRDVERHLGPYAITPLDEASQIMEARTSLVPGRLDVQGAMEDIAHFAFPKAAYPEMILKIGNRDPTPGEFGIMYHEFAQFMADETPATFGLLGELSTLYFVDRNSIPERHQANVEHFRGSLDRFVLG